MRLLLIHIRNKYGEKIKEVQGLSPGTLRCLEIRKWGRQETEKSGESIQKDQSFSVKELRKQLKADGESRKGWVI